MQDASDYKVPLAKVDAANNSAEETKRGQLERGDADILQDGSSDVQICIVRVVDGG